MNQRIDLLNDRARAHSYDFRRQFLGQPVEVMVEHSSPSPSILGEGRGEGLIRHGRCERYFDVSFVDPTAKAGDPHTLRVTHVDENSTFGERKEL